MIERDPLTYGQVFTTYKEDQFASLLSEAFPTVQVRESCHYKTGKYVLIEFFPETEYFFEKINSEEYLVRGEGADCAGLGNAAQAIAAHLGKSGFKCRFETYDSENSLTSYFHHNWPLEHE